ncbi:MAG: hypothetical protein K8S87_08650, partial [Planctomycetes bacterium]|nr:hypothetical protein [Planctomycetota bacterium]
AKRFTNYVLTSIDNPKLKSFKYWVNDTTFYTIPSHIKDQNSIIHKYEIKKTLDKEFITKYEYVEIDKENARAFSNTFYNNLLNKYVNNRNNDNKSENNYNNVIDNIRIFSITITENLSSNREIIIFNITNPSENDSSLLFFEGDFHNLKPINVHISGDLINNNELVNYLCAKPYQIVDVDNDGKRDILIGSGNVGYKEAIVLFNKTEVNTGDMIFESLIIKAKEKTYSDIGFVKCDDFNGDGNNQLIVSRVCWNNYSIHLYTYNTVTATFIETDSFMLGNSLYIITVNEKDEKYIIVSSSIIPAYGDYYLLKKDTDNAECGIYVFQVSKDNKLKLVSNILTPMDFVDNLFLLPKGMHYTNLEKLNSEYVLSYGIIESSYFETEYPKKIISYFRFVKEFTGLNDLNNSVTINYELHNTNRKIPHGLRNMDSLKNPPNRFYVELSCNDIRNIKELDYNNIINKYELEHHVLFGKLNLYRHNIIFIEDRINTNVYDESMITTYLHSVTKLLENRNYKSIDDLNKVTNKEILKRRMNDMYYDILDYIIVTLGFYTKSYIKESITNFIVKFLLTTRDIETLEEYLLRNNIPTNSKEIIEDVIESTTYKPIFEYNNGIIKNKGNVIDNDSKYDYFYSFPDNVIYDAIYQDNMRRDVIISSNRTSHLSYYYDDVESKYRLFKPNYSYAGNIIDFEKECSFKYVLDMNWNGMQFGAGRDIGLFGISERNTKSGQLNLSTSKGNLCYFYSASSGGGFSTTSGFKLSHNICEPNIINHNFGHSYNDSFIADDYRVTIEYNKKYEKLSYCVYDKKNNFIVYRNVMDGIKPLPKGRYFFGVITPLTESYTNFNKINIKINKISFYGDNCSFVKDNTMEDDNKGLNTINRINRFIMAGNYDAVVSEYNKLKSVYEIINNSISNNFNDEIVREILKHELMSSLYASIRNDDDNSLLNIYKIWRKVIENNTSNSMAYKKRTNLLYFIANLNDYIFYDDFMIKIGKALVKFDKIYCNFSDEELVSSLFLMLYDKNGVPLDDDTLIEQLPDEYPIIFYLINVFKNAPEKKEYYNSLTWLKLRSILQYGYIWQFSFNELDELCAETPFINKYIQKQYTDNLLQYYGLYSYSAGFYTNAIKIFNRIKLEDASGSKILNNRIYMIKLLINRVKNQKKYLDLQYNSFNYIPE